MFDGVTGNYPGAPFAYAAEESGTIGVAIRDSDGNGGRFLLVGNAGYMGDYARDAAYQRTLIDPVTLQPVLEPAYTIVNTRFVYEPPARNFSVEVWGKNLLDEIVHQRRVRHSRHVGLRLLDRRSVARSRCRSQLRVLVSGATKGKRGGPLGRFAFFIPQVQQESGPPPNHASLAGNDCRLRATHGLRPKQQAVLSDLRKNKIG